MEAKMLEILDAVKDNKILPENALDMLLTVYTEMASSRPQLQHLVYVKDACSYDWLHLYTNKKYHSVELIGRYGYSADDIIALIPKF